MHPAQNAVQEAPEDQEAGGDARGNQAAVLDRVVGWPLWGGEISTES